MKPRIRLHGTCLLVLCLVCISAPAWGVNHTVQFEMTPAPIARGETLTIGVLLDNKSGQPLENATLYVPLPVGIDQWRTEVRIDGGAWMEYPANGLIVLDPIPSQGQTSVDIQVPVEPASPATLTVTVQLLDTTGILAEEVGWVNVLPNVDAGPDLIAELGMPMPLSDPSASDGGGTITGYLWTDHVAGGAFDNSGTLHPIYTPPTISGVIELNLTVTDSDGGESNDSLRLRVNAVPQVEIGGDVEAEEGSRLTIWQATVSDPDGWIADIMWNDDGAGGTFLPSNDVVDPVYLVPDIEGCDDGQILLTIVVTDDWGAMGTDSLAVTVFNINELPVVYVPEEREAEAGQRVELSAIASDDDGWIETQGWGQVNGIDIDLVVGSQDQHVWFAAPDVGIPQELVFRFRAVDNCDAEVWADVAVTVVPQGGSDGAPVDDGSLLISLDVFDDRGFPMSPFDTPRDGDSISVRLSVINTGPSRLRNLTATLNNQIPVTLLPDVLEPWSSTSGVSDWLVGSDDLVDGLEIVGTVVGTDEAGRIITASDAFQFLGEPSSDGPSLVLEMTSSVSQAVPGEIVVYDYRLTNIGPNNLTSLTLYDDHLGWIELPTGVLRTGEAIEVQATYTIRDADLPGPVVNQANATGFTLQGDKVESKTEVSVELIELGGGGGGAVPLQQGRIVISEIAWAGSQSDPAAEWIELANIGTASVDLIGWKLSWYEKMGSVPPSSQWRSIELSGVIHPLTEDAWRTATLEFTPLEDGLWSVHDPRWSVPSAADGYFVMERAHDNAVANVPAGLIYGDAVNPYFDLPDSGAAIFLIDPDGGFVDSANAQYSDRTGWPAGNSVTYATMERVNLSQGDFDGNWQTTSGVLTYGVDKAGHGLMATAGMPNSLPLETLLQDAAASVEPVLSAGRISVQVPESVVGDRPIIQVAALAGSGAAGGGGSVGSPGLSTIRNGEGLTVEADLEHASAGEYAVWISLKNGRTFLLPLRK